VNGESRDANALSDIVFMLSAKEDRKEECAIPKPTAEM